jgi:RNA polymerase sigma-70 factor (sigma-E family)
MRQLVAGAQGPRSAEQEEAVALYAAHRLRLVRLAVLLVDDLQTAEDVVQDAFAAFLVRRGELDDQDKALAYLRTSVVNGARSKLRRRRTARAYVPPHEVPRDGTAEGVLLAEEHREVLAAMQQLGSRQREVLVLRYWSGLSEAEIAEALGISRGAVKSTASRALDALERIMEVSR